MISIRNNLLPRRGVYRRILPIVNFTNHSSPVALEGPRLADGTDLSREAGALLGLSYVRGGTAFPGHVGQALRASFGEPRRVAESSLPLSLHLNSLALVKDIQKPIVPSVDNGATKTALPASIAWSS